MLGLGAWPEVWVCLVWPGANGPPPWWPSGLLQPHQPLLSWSWWDVKTTIQLLLFHSLDQPDRLISLITWCTRLTPANHWRDAVNVCSELLHLHGYIYSHALMFDKEEAYENQPQGRRWTQGHSDGCKDAPILRGPDHTFDITLDGMSGRRVMIWWMRLLWIPSVRMEEGEDAVAIIGIGCNFPGGESTKVRPSRLFFWHFHLFASLWV